jgi:hypothetical protein
VHKNISSKSENPYIFPGEFHQKIPGSQWCPSRNPVDLGGGAVVPVPKPDEGSEPPASLPKFVNLEWWQSLGCENLKALLVDLVDDEFSMMLFVWGNPMIYSDLMGFNGIYSDLMGY